MIDSNPHILERWQGQGGASLVVQWLRIRLPMQGAWVRYLVKELRSHLPRSSPCTTTGGACVPQVLSPVL